MSRSPSKGSSISQSSTLEYSRNASSRGLPVMLITISACSHASGEILFGSKPSTQYPFLLSVSLVNHGIKPIGAKPALNASIASGASWRAIASAIGLRQAFPMQTNMTFMRSSFLFIGRYLSNDQLSSAGCLTLQNPSATPYSRSGPLPEPPHEAHDI